MFYGNTFVFIKTQWGFKFQTSLVFKWYVMRLLSGQVAFNLCGYKAWVLYISTTISTSVWSAQHTNAGRNLQHMG